MDASVHDSRPALARSERAGADLRGAAASRGQHRRRARQGVHAAGCRRACRPSGRASPWRQATPTPRNPLDVGQRSRHRGACGRRGTRRRPAGAGGAQSRRPRLGSARAGEGRTARRAGGVRESRATPSPRPRVCRSCGRIRPASTSPRRERAPICAAWRSRVRSIQRVRATRRAGSAS